MSAVQTFHWSHFSGESKNTCLNLALGSARSVFNTILFNNRAGTHLVMAGSIKKMWTGRSLSFVVHICSQTVFCLLWTAAYFVCWILCVVNSLTVDWCRLRWLRCKANKSIGSRIKMWCISWREWRHVTSEEIFFVMFCLLRKQEPGQFEKYIPQCVATKEKYRYAV